MKGGMKFYRGSGKAARAYVEADHNRADDYYLAEGTGIAELLVVTGPQGTVVDRAQLGGDEYEAWVEGHDVLAEGQPLKGRVRQDEHALRFAEVIVNGPKSWSLAAGLHPEISAAYDRVQNAACEDIARFLSANVSTRVGRRGEQRQIPAERVELARIGHFTSRAGDPHRHIHLQVNARVFAGGKWRGIDSAAMLRMQRAINGIGSLSVASNPEFRAALAAHGYTVNAVSGEIDQLAAVVPAMSKRSAQVADNITRYEREWRQENPGLNPSAVTLRAFDARAWADAREAKKNHPTHGADAELAWMTELSRLGVSVDAHRTAAPVELVAETTGRVDRTAAAQRVLRVLSAGARGRSTWNDYDIRGVAEEVLAAGNLVADRAVLDELAEDVTARVKAASLTVVDGPVPAHVRHMTSQEVLDLEADIRGRLAVRAAVQGGPAPLADVAEVIAEVDPDAQLDRAQLDGVRAIAGDAAVVLVEGAAGTGKSTMLAGANTAIERVGRQMVLVAPSRNAALVAAEKVGAAQAPAAAGLAFQHGYRWDEAGVWSRLNRGDICPLTGDPYMGPAAWAQLRPGDVVVVDEAGMLDQETARALLTVADETNARVVFMGDRRQLPAVGRGGVLGMVAQWAPAPVELGAVHRFRAHDGGRDQAYADLSLRIRSGVDPEAVFDELVARGHVRLHRTDADALAVIAIETADRVIAGDSQSVSLGTNEAVEAVNHIVRERLVDAGVVDNTVTVHGSDGLEIGVGDRVTTRENDNQRGIANRMTWTVTNVANDGSLSLVDARPDGTRRDVTVDPDYARENVHLAYVSTAHGVQGQTSDHGRTRLTDSTDAAALYVGLTRGSVSNQVHIVADNPPQAREQWIAAAGRDRADYGLDHASTAASHEAQDYAVQVDQPPSVASAERATEPAEGLGEREPLADRLTRIKSSRSARSGTARRARTQPAGLSEREQRRREERAEYGLDGHGPGQQSRQRGPRI